MCPVCNTSKLTGRQKYCSGACRVKASRSSAEPILASKTKETAEEWLARRVIETGSTGWQWVKTGKPPGDKPSIKVPIKWDPIDIDDALLFDWTQG